MQGALQGNSGRSAGCKDRHPLPTATGRENFVDSLIDPGAKLPPGLYVIHRKGAAHPLHDNNLIEALKSSAPLIGFHCVNKCGVKIADAPIGFKQDGSAMLQYRFCGVFIELGKNFGCREVAPEALIRDANQLHRVSVPNTWAGKDAVEKEVARRPVFAEYLRLRFSNGG